MDWLSSHGGAIKEPKTDTVARLSLLGAEGRHPGNAERDAHRALHKLTPYLDATVSYRDVRLVDPSTLEVSWGKLPMILPHDICLALWRQGEHVFRHCLFGDLRAQEIAEFWDHAFEHCDWFQQHPLSSLPDRSKLVGVSTYGDEIQAFRNSECGSVAVCAWTADLAYLNDPLLRYFPIAVWSEHHESEHTYHDVMRYVVRSFRRLGDPSAQFPWTDHGYCFAFTSAQGDLKWITERMNLHNYRRNDFCSRCLCKKVSPNSVYETLPYFPDNHDHFGWQDYSGVDMVKDFSVLFSLPLTVGQVLHDTCHSQFLGTGKSCNGFPVLQSKAVASKILTKWLTKRAQKWAERPGATEIDKAMASCIFSYNMAICIMDSSRHVLTQEQANQFKYFVLRHLELYAYLHAHGMRAALNTVGRRCWLLQPKLHFLWHAAHDVARTRLNPKMTTLLSAESFVGILGRIARACHRASLSLRTLERYQLKMITKISTIPSP
eukprot:Skav208363  [mRNA]  locus=scaffold1964:445984:447889:- [translate_table: standard]